MSVDLGDWTSQPGSSPAAVLRDATYWVSAGSLSQAYLAGDNLQVLVMMTGTDSAYLLYCRRVELTIESVSAPTVVLLSIIRLDGTILPTGATDRTAISVDNRDPSLHAPPTSRPFFGTYPTGLGSTNGIPAIRQSFSLAASVNPTDVSKLTPLRLYDWSPSTDTKPLTMRGAGGALGNGEGWALMCRSSAAATIVMSVSAQLDGQPPGYTPN